MTLHKQIYVRVPNQLLILTTIFMVIVSLSIEIFNVSPPKFFFPKHVVIKLADENSLIINDSLTNVKHENFEKKERELELKISSANSRVLLGLIPKNLPPEKKVVISKNQYVFPKELEYELNSDNEIRVPRTYLTRLPDLNKYETAERKKKFIQIILPLILRCNEEINSHKKTVNIAIKNNDRKKIFYYAEKYKIKTFDLTITHIKKELKIRIQEIPLEIAIAQAAVESGWGISRFAVEGNALFGQWTWDKKNGIIPVRAKNKNIAVKAFPNLISSVRNYMININTHNAYRKFRENRYKLIEKSEPLDAKYLINYLENYAETGKIYTNTLSKMIDQNNLTLLRDAKLKYSWFWE